MKRNLIIVLILGLALAGAVVHFLMPQDISDKIKPSSKEKAEEFVEEVRSPEEEALRMQAIQAIREKLEEKNFERAYEMANDLLKRDPKEPYGYYVAGLIELAAGEFPRGRRKLLDAIDLGLDFKDAATAYYNLGIMEKKQGDLEKAEEYLRLAIQANPTDSNAEQALLEITVKNE